MADLATLFIKVDSKGVVTASKDLNKLTGDSKKAETATKGVTKSFSKLQAVVVALASSYALLKMAQYVKDATMLAARYETLGVVMRVVGNNAEYTGAQMDKFALGLQTAGIAMVESRNTLARMIQAQIDLTNSQKLARIAQDAAVIGNINSSEAFEHMIYGLQTGHPRILRTIGLNVDFDASVRALADSLGIEKDALNEAQIMQGRVNAAMKAGVLIQGAYSSAMETAGKKMLSLQRHLDNLEVLFGAAFTPALAEIIDTITKGLKDLNGELSGEGVEAIKDWGNNFRLTIMSIEAEIMRLAMFIDKIGGTLTWLPLLLYAPGKALGIESSTKRFEAMADINIMLEGRYRDTEKALEALAVRYNELAAAMTPAGKAAAKAEQDAAETVRIAAAKVAKAEQDKADAIAKASERIKKAREEINKILSENVYELQSIGKSQYEQDLIQIQKSVQTFRDAGAEKIDIARFVASETGIAAANEADRQADEANRQAEEIRKATSEAAQDRLDMQIDFDAQYAAIGKSRVDLEKEAIWAQGAVWKEAGFEQIKIKEWINAEIKKLEDDRVSGAKTGLEDYAKTAMDVAGNIQNAVENAFKGMEDALVDFCMTGKLDFADFANSIIRDILRIHIQSQITGVLASAIGGYFGGTSVVQGTGINTAAQQGIPNVITTWGQGGAFPAGISTHSNSVVNKPTLFSFAQGAGVFGEAGPEAIMPLTRLPGGDLGVKAEPNKTATPIMTVNIHEAPGTQTRVEQSEDGQNLNIIIEQVEQAMTGRMERGTGMAPFMDGRYGRVY